MQRALSLTSTGASGPLVPATLAQALARLAAESGAIGVAGSRRAPRGAMRGQVLRLASALLPDDDAAAAFVLDFVGQGKLVRGTANGPSAELLAWAFHALAARLPCLIEDDAVEGAVTPDPAAHLDAAMAYLAAYEAEVREDRALPSIRRAAPEEGGPRLLAWLAREEHLALADDEDAVRALGASLPMGDPSALYEVLLEAEAVEDVFVSESELSSLLARFRARAPAGA